MRFFRPINVLMAGMMLVGCGGGSTSSKPVHEQRGPVGDSAKPPGIHVPPGPPPRNLVIKDLKKGTGAAIPPNASIGITTHYISVSYKTGKPYEVRWSRTDPFTIEFGPGLEIKGWEKGLPGMRVGGRRELIVPSRLAYGHGALLYVVDLLAVK
jgi:hypothetical protein